MASGRGHSPTFLNRRTLLLQYPGRRKLREVLQILPFATADLYRILTSYPIAMTSLGQGDLPSHTRVDGDSVLDMENFQHSSPYRTRRTTKLTHSRPENDSDVGMDLDGDEDVDTPARMGGGGGPDSESYGAITHGDEVVLASDTKLQSLALSNESHDVFRAVYGNTERHDDDPDDDEWLDSVSVRADTQSIIGGDSEDGETGEDDDEMLCVDEAILAGASDKIRVSD
ncbi:hypothetical protein BC826DRAFT_1018801 [Russula brevipes]|nr:hypothetical protein BC826DRAFT_1018801 [Russula brevipes]